MVVDKSAGDKAFNVLNAVVLGILMLLFVLPFVYMFSISISDPELVGKYKVGLFPQGINFEAYKTLLNTKSLFVSYYNSIRYALIGTVFSLTIAFLTAYPLSLKRFRYRTPFALFFTFTMFFSGGLIPTFLLYQNLRLIDTLWVIVLPGAFSFWNIILVRTNFQAIPYELFESAYIDGANDWSILFRIVLPLSKAILATIALFASVGLWNSFFPPMMYLNSADMQPLTILLRRMLIANEVFSETDVRSDIVDPLIYSGQIVSLRMATIFVTIGPIILVYPFVQKYFVKGVMIGSVKG